LGLATLYGFAFFSHQVGGFLGVLLGAFVFREISGQYTPILVAARSCSAFLSAADQPAIVEGARWHARLRSRLSPFTNPEIKAKTCGSLRWEPFKGRFQGRQAEKIAPPSSSRNFDEAD